MKLYANISENEYKALKSGSYEAFFCDTLQGNIGCRRMSFKPEKATEGVTCEFEADSENVFVLEGAFESDCAEINELFFEKKTRGDAYRLGQFIKPVPFLFGKPVSVRLFDESFTDMLGDGERFYISCLTEKLREQYDEFDLFAVRSTLEALVAKGKMTKQDNGGYIIYRDRNGGVIPVCRHFENGK